MKCPECDGLGIIHIPATAEHQRYDIPCPTCDGTGKLPDPQEFPNNCPACGEPIRADQKWCERHKEAENILLEEEEWYCTACGKSAPFCSYIVDPDSDYFDEPACYYCGERL